MSNQIEMEIKDLFAEIARLLPKLAYPPEKSPQKLVNLLAAYQAVIDSLTMSPLADRQVFAAIENALNAREIFNEE